MQITIELFGIPRSRAGIDKTVASGSCLGEVLAELATRYPQLAETCIDGHRLRPGFTANISGERFVTDPKTQFSDGDTLLLLTLDAGG